MTEINNFLSEELMKGTDWRAMERAVARFMYHCGWNEVRLVGRRGDGGADIIGKRDNKVFIVQVKAVTGAKYIGPDALNEVIDALSLYGGDIAIVATNGDFTQSAFKRVQELSRLGFDCRLWNGSFMKSLLRKWPNQHWDKRQPRPYQEKVINRVFQKYRDGGKAVQYVVATGLGKTTIAAGILETLRAEGLNRVLVLCHSQDLSLQLDQSFWSQIEQEVQTHVFFDGLPPKRFNGINFGTYQTLIGYLPSLNQDDFDVVVVDEAHHAMSDGFLLCLNHLRPKLLIGMTATPWRGDSVSLDTVFGEPVAQISLVDGMKMGYLAKVSYRVFCDTVDWEKVFEYEEAKTHTIKDLNKRLFLPQRDEAMISETLKVSMETTSPRVIFFCSSIEHCKRVADLVNLSGSLKCKPVSGISRVERFRTLMEFSSGRIQAVTAVDVLNEGIDVPDVNIIVFLRVTHSRRIFVQQLGRGLRLSRNKTTVTVLDFVSDLRRVADLISLDREARDQSSDPFTTVYFPKGIVKFENEGILPFVEKWLADVTKSISDEENNKLIFPSEVNNEEIT
ncbi:DEAD/DEAH box helicase family protein [Paenibacillus timonensis]|uniref:DEAD/DEAH box helicase family protein n=1 Tax=Paenibacillus timonensis TaxID=225915 RepID=A0ABW3S721_9BACL|nr:DEAD/DEAH box helicase family protein [Paenibacillus timonensis]MCH1638936.1 DEAD/DEAH box helicase family protein [Paenibacillus timonensis]